MKRSAGTTLRLVAICVATTSPAFAGPLGEIGGNPGSARSVHSPREALNLSMPAIANSARRPQRLEEPGYLLGGLQDRSARAGPSDANDQGRSRVAFAIQWQRDDVPLVNPRIASLVRNFRHDGLPLVHLWESGRNLLAIGLNPRGKPSIYFTQQLPR